MLTEVSSETSELLAQVAESLDIPDHLYEDAVLKYEKIGAWLAEENSELQKFDPEIYPQGSFRLGTMIRPLTEKDEYDIDLVCHLKIKKESTTQKNLKEIVGDRLKKQMEFAKILEERRRCWCLDYPNQFHMDVLSAIPNEEKPPTGILLTDTELREWQKSNPIIYSEWFYEQMKVALNETKAALAESLKASIEEVPDWQVKTPLQRAIQLLKRHRDIHFQNNPKNKPVSIIITTLAAKAYENQIDIFDALLGIVEDMPNFIEKRNDKWWVPNPVDPDENFADKWNEKPLLSYYFFKWLEKVKNDFSVAQECRHLNEAIEVLKPIIGQRTLANVAHKMGLTHSMLLVPSTSQVVKVPSLDNTSHCKALIWPERINYKASIKAAVYTKTKKPKKLWVLTDRPVPKNIDLRFQMTTNVPRPYDIHWQVVNTGHEAAVENGLRGGFYLSDNNNGTVRWESTLYKGTHWIEAFVIKNGVCVARSGRKYVKIRG